MWGPDGTHLVMARRDRGPDVSDARLVGRARAGDQDAFAQLVRRYRASVRSMCRRILGDTAEADDVEQEASLQAYLGLERLADASNFGPWFHAIGANLARKAIRKRRPTPMGDLREDQHVLWLAADPGPEDAVGAREIHDLILACLLAVPQVNREALVRYYLGGYTYAEIAAILGVPTSTVRGRLFAGRRRLRRALMETPLAAEWRKELMRETELVPVRVGDFVGRTMDLAHRMVLLREEDGRREMPVMMTPDEGDAVEGALAETPPQPPVHDLVLRALQAMRGRVERSVVDNLDEDSCYAKVLLTGPDGSQTVDARASDGIVLALLTGARVYVARAVFDQEAIDPLDMTQRRRMAAAARAAIQQRLKDRGAVPELVPPEPHRSLDPAARSQAEDSLGRLVAELGARSALLIEQGGTVLASHGPGDPGLAARYAAARALGDTDLTELSMLDLFPEEEVDCVVHATSTDGQLRLEAALPVGFGEQTAEQARAQGERLQMTVDELAVLLPSR
jgi:RNA polymerase sigma-70 factor (ECF subfamily)